MARPHACGQRVCGRAGRMSPGARRFCRRQRLGAACEHASQPAPHQPAHSAGPHVFAGGAAWGPRPCVSALQNSVRRGGPHRPCTFQHLIPRGLPVLWMGYQWSADTMNTTFFGAASAGGRPQRHAPRQAGAERGRNLGGPWGGGQSSVHALPQARCSRGRAGGTGVRGRANFARHAGSVQPCPSACASTAVWPFAPSSRAMTKALETSSAVNQYHANCCASLLLFTRRQKCSSPFRAMNKVMPTKKVVQSRSAGKHRSMAG